MALRAAAAGAPSLRPFAGSAALAVLLVSCAAAPPSAASPARPAALAERLPEAAAGFRRGEVRPAGEAGEGRVVAYATASGRLTAAATVELLAEGTAAAAALDAALADAARAGPGREVREAGRYTFVVANGSPLFCAHTAGRYGRERVAGLVCAGRVGGALLRITVAMPARDPPPADPRAFAETIATALAGGPAVAAAPSG